MNIRHSSFDTRHSRGFTLIELLIVIGIILILIGILLPTVNQVRVAAQTANTRQMLARIEAGIQSYYSDFQSYPGPFPNAGLKPFFAGPYVIGGQNMSGVTTAVTSTENLYLALAGGLQITINAGPPPTVATSLYNPTLALNLNGAANLNPAALKRYQAYISLDSFETTLNVENAAFPGPAAGQWTPATATNLTPDTIVPEIVDKYSRPAPILYMRATRGEATMLNETAAFAPTAQYHTRQVTHTYAGTVRNGTNAMDTAWTTWVGTDYPAAGTLTAGLEAYFGNSALSAAAATPYKKDEFILISAGPDGKYGTRDDVTNFRQN